MSGPPLEITVVINSRNRVDCLRETLHALSRVALPVTGGVELIVVDNGSTDDTERMARSFRWPGVEVRVLHLAEPGVARAKNAAIACARGKVLLFTDDDVRPPANWLIEMSIPILSGTADAVSGGVRIPEDVKPNWATPMHEEWLASTAHWEATRTPVLVGANMAVGRQVFDRVGVFDEALSHGEDTLLSYVLSAAGFRVILRHDVIVDHLVQPERFHRRGITAQARRRAEWHAYEVHHWEHGTRTFPHLRWLRALWRLQWYRLRHGYRLTDESLSPEEMTLLREAAFWPAYLRVRREPRRYHPGSRDAG